MRFYGGKEGDLVLVFLFRELLNVNDKVVANVDVSVGDILIYLALCSIEKAKNL